MAGKLIVLLFASCLSNLWGQGTLEGRVEFAPSVRKSVTPARYQSKVQPGKPAPQVAVVYLEGNFSAEKSTNQIAVLGQQHLQFEESILPIQTGTTVEFPNYDEEYHNVLSYSRTRKFDLGRYLKDEKPPAIKFDKPGWVDLNCEIHSHMFANILVLDTPYFTRTDTNGTYRLENLPAGDYQLKAWISPKLTLSKTVTIKNGETSKADLTAK